MRSFLHITLAICAGLAVGCAEDPRADPPIPTGAAELDAVDARLRVSTYGGCSCRDDGYAADRVTLTLDLESAADAQLTAQVMDVEAWPAGHPDVAIPLSTPAEALAAILRDGEAMPLTWQVPYAEAWGAHGFGLYTDWGDYPEEWILRATIEFEAPDGQTRTVTVESAPFIIYEGAIG